MYIEQITSQIKEFADKDAEHGWFEHVHDGKLYKFPKRAFLHYLFGNSQCAKRLLPEYNAFSSRNVKMYNDNPFHTDTWLGAGFPLELAYERDGAEINAFWDAGNALEDEMRTKLRFDFTVLANGLPEKLTQYGNRLMVYESLKVLEPNTISNIHILCQKKRRDGDSELRAIVIPHAGIEYDLVAKNADIIITEKGGPLAHLATVSREKGKLLIRVDDAVRKFPPFSRLRLNLNDLSLTIPGKY